MSNNTLINAVIAIIEDKPQTAREMLRSPEMRISSSELSARVYKALHKRSRNSTTQAMLCILRETLRVDVKARAEKLGLTWDESHEEAFLQGVAYVESYIDDYIYDSSAA